MSRREVFNTAIALPATTTVAGITVPAANAEAVPDRSTPGRLRRFWSATCDYFKAYHSGGPKSDDENDAFSSRIARMERIILAAPIRSLDDCHVKLECLQMIGMYTGALQDDEVHCLSKVVTYLAGPSEIVRFMAGRPGLINAA